ncbi:MAG: hypothetical protein AAGA11_06325 [Pseudomonadota bacterium]
MRASFCLLVWVASTTAVVANPDPHAPLFGTWGTASHCARLPIQPGGTVLAEPFEVGPDWLRHGTLWCALTWGPVQPRDNGLFSAAHARCGEDAVRAYFLRFNLEDDALTLRWGPFLSNSDLLPCDSR